MQLEQSAPVIDGLVFYSDGDATDLLSGGVSAVNLTVVYPLADLRQAIDELSEWLKRLGDPESQWRLVSTTDDIRRAGEEGKVGLIMGWQNMLPVEDRLDRLTLFHRLGVRVMQLTYNDANFIGDGCLERRDGGLTEFGRRAVAEMNAVGIAIDLSHCGEKVCLDAAELSNKPILLTHANAKAVFNQPRNKSDDALRAVARTGGVIGLSIHGFMNWSGNAAEPPSLEGIAEQAKYVRNLVGIDHIGVGTDFASLGDKSAADYFLAMSKSKYSGTAGAFVRAFGNRLEDRYPKDTPTPRQFPRIFDALARAGFKSAEIEKIAGGNFVRAFREIWGN